MNLKRIGTFGLPCGRTARTQNTGVLLLQAGGYRHEATRQGAGRGRWRLLPFIFGVDDASGRRD